MNSSDILIQLDGKEPAGGPVSQRNRIYRPGEILSGQYTIAPTSLGGTNIAAVEVSVLWYSEGKGDEDLDVHEFWRKSTDDGDFVDPHRPERFSTTLPYSPLSYDGLIVKIRWCVRVRAFVGRKEIVAEEAFRLGSVPPPEEEAEQ